MSVKILYFAWVREKIGKAEEIVDLPAGVETVADLVAWLTQRGPEYAEAFARAGRGARGRRPDARAADRQHRRRARDRVLPARHRRLTVSVRVQSEDFEIGAEVAPPHRRPHRHRRHRHVHRHGARATTTAAPIAGMTLEHYPGMTEQELARVEAEASARWPLQASLIVHRVGTLKPGDNIVLVVTASAHREAAFDAAAFLMDYLKTRAPFWKKEVAADGTERWVDARDSDDRAAARWRKP